MLSPIFLALTAATPVLRGKLADTDVRWDTLTLALALTPTPTPNPTLTPKPYP